MKTIVIYVHDLRSSGVVVNAIALARRLAQDHHVILCAGRADGFFADTDVSPARLEILRDAPDRWPRLAAAGPLRALLKRHKADIIISEGNFGHLSVWLAGRGLGTARIYTISNEIKRGDSRDPLRRFWTRRIIADATRLRFVGRTLAGNPLFAQAKADGKAVYISNAIDIQAARGKFGGPPPHRWLTPGNPPVIVAIGRLNRQKNLEGLIRAMALVRSRQPARLIILGSGPETYRAHLQQIAVESGIAEDVLFPGETVNVFVWLTHAAVFALPSLWEGSSTALLEAMAVRIPIVASYQAGDAAHVLANGTYGELVNAQDPADIARGILLQLSGDAIHPGNRIEDFSLAATHDRVAAMIDTLPDGRSI